MKTKLIFVYNADSSIFAQATDYVHKALKPDTYECNLCKITHSNFGMKKEWKNFIQTLPYDLEFIHRDDFIKNYPDHIQTQFPAIFLMSNSLEMLVTENEINSISNIVDLKNIINVKLNRTK